MRCLARDIPTSGQWQEVTLFLHCDDRLGEVAVEKSRDGVRRLRAYRALRRLRIAQTWIATRTFGPQRGKAKRTRRRTSHAGDARSDSRRLVIAKRRTLG